MSYSLLRLFLTGSSKNSSSSKDAGVTSKCEKSTSNTTALGYWNNFLYCSGSYGVYIANTTAYMPLSYSSIFTSVFPFWSTYAVLAYKNYWLSKVNGKINYFMPSTTWKSRETSELKMIKVFSKSTAFIQVRMVLKSRTSIKICIAYWFLWGNSLKLFSFRLIKRSLKWRLISELNTGAGIVRSIATF